MDSNLKANRHIGVCGKCGTVFAFGKSGVFIHTDINEPSGVPMCDECGKVKRHPNGLVKSIGDVVQDYDNLT